jgi:hypothetical protein
MPGQDKILSQAEIDELLSKKAPKLKPRSPVASTTATVKPSEPPKVKVVNPPVSQSKATPPPAPLAKTAVPSAPPPKAAAPSASPPKAAAPPAPAPNAATPPETPTGPMIASYRHYTSDEVANLQETVAELARHLVKLSSVMQRVDKIEEKIEQIAAVIKLNPDTTTLFERRLDEIHNILETLIQNKADVRDEFQCSKCQSKKAVAIHVKCTACGNENWMGWWPETDLKQQDDTDNP